MTELIVKRHAYNIIAHSNLYVLNRLIMSIDDVRNDIFIHIDPKSSIAISDIQKTTYSQIRIYKEISVYWGHTSMIEVELFLYEQAQKNDVYSYYHLLSGVDLPIKSQDHIHDFFDKNAGKEFIGYSQSMMDYEKVNKLHLFPKNLRVTEKQYILRLKRKLRKAFIEIQRLVNYNKVRDSSTYKFGAVWTSLTHNLVLELIGHKIFFLKMYKNSSCVDEIYKHTYVYNSEHRKNIYDVEDELNSCQRLIDWKRGDPYTFHYEDLDLIQNSKLLFARKFDETIDLQIINKLTM